MNNKILYTIMTVLIISIVFTGRQILFGENQLANISSSIERFNDDDSRTISKFEQLAITRVVSAVNTSTGKLLFLKKDSNQIMEVAIVDDSESVLTELPISEVDDIIWAPNGNEVIFKNKQGQFVNYILENNQSSKLNGSIKSVVFSPNSKQIAYFFYDPAGLDSNISISQSDGAVFKSLIKTRLDSVDLWWPKENIIAFKKKNVASENSDLFVFDVTTENITKIVENKVGLNVKWSKSGNNLLFSYFNRDDELILYHRDLINNTNTVAPFSTFASKCSWGIAEETIYCGVLKKPPLGPIRVSYVASDDIIQSWNKQEGDVQTLLESSSFEKIRVTQPFTSNLGENFIFINSLDNHLYRLSI